MGADLPHKGRRFPLIPSTGTTIFTFSMLRYVFANAILIMVFEPISTMASTLQAQEFSYTTNADNTITITDCSSSSEHIYIPDAINGLPVTSIREEAFYYCSNLTGIAIGRNITSVDYLWCDGISSLAAIDVDPSNTVFSALNGILYDKQKTTLIRYPPGKTGRYTIPDSITSIEPGAFNNCLQLYTIDVGVSNTVYNSLGGVLYDRKKNTLIKCPAGRVGDYTIPNSVTSIADWAFLDCTGLTTAIISSNVTSIGDGAFYFCTNMAGIEIPDSVTKIGDSAFNCCFSLTNITIGSRVTSIGSWAFHNCRNLQSITIPDSVTFIGDYALNACSSLINANIGNGITNISENLLSDCTSLHRITIGSGVSDIDTMAFYSCTSLSALRVTPANKTYTSLDGILYTSDMTMAIFCPVRKSGHYSPPSSVTNIRRVAFSGCSELTSITMPDTITFIGDGAFSCCTGLTNVTFGSNITTICSGTFRFCTNLTSVAIPDSVTSIDYWAFYRCLSLRDVIIGIGVTNIGSGAFSSCDNLTTVLFRGNAPHLESMVFYKSTDATIYHTAETSGWPIPPELWGDRPTALKEF